MIKAVLGAIKNERVAADRMSRNWLIRTGLINALFVVPLLKLVA
jgi:hypothetical protein